MLFLYSLLISLVFVANNTAAETGEWLGDDKGYYLNISYGAGSDNLSVMGVDILVPSIANSLIDLSYSRLDSESALSDYTFEQKFIAWQTDPYEKWSFGLSYASNGEAQELEIKELSPSITYSSNQWSTQLAYINANIQGYSEGELELVRGTKTGLRGRLDYDADNWGIGVSYQDNSYSYQSRAPLRLQFRIENSDDYRLSRNALRQILSLTNWEADLQGYYLFERWMLSAGASNYELRRHSEKGAEYFVGANVELTNKLELGLQSSIDDEGVAYGEISLGLTW